MQESQTTEKQYRIPLFCLVTVLFWASLYTYVPVLTSYIESLGASHKLAGIIVGSYGFVQMLLRIPVGILSDRFHKRRLFISFGMFFSLFSALGLLIFKDLGLVLFFRAFAGAAAATWVDFTILFTSYFRHEEATKAIGIISFYNTIGQTVAMFAGGYAADMLGWSAPFSMAVAIGLAGLLLSFFIVEKFDESAQKLTLRGLTYVATNSTLISVSLLAILSQVVTFATVFGFTPVFAEQQLHVTKSEMGLLTVFSALPSAFASLIAGNKLLGRFGEKKIIIAGFLLTGVFTVTIPFTSSFWLLLVTQVFAGFGRGLSFPMLMGLSIKDMPSDKRATAMGFFQAIYGLGMFAGPVIMGIIGDWLSLGQGFVFLGIISLLTALLSQIAIKFRTRIT